MQSTGRRRRWLGVAVLVAASIAQVAFVWMARAQRDEAFALVRQREALEREHRLAEAARARLEEARRHDARIEQLLAQAQGSFNSLLPFDRRSVSVEQQVLSRAEADDYLRAFDRQPESFFVVDSFNLRTARAERSLFDASAEPSEPGALIMTLKGTLVGRSR